jgi:hypothetical protein
VPENKRAPFTHIFFKNAPKNPLPPLLFDREKFFSAEVKFNELPKMANLCWSVFENGDSPNLGKTPFK